MKNFPPISAVLTLMFTKNIKDGSDQMRCNIFATGIETMVKDKKELTMDSIKEAYGYQSFIYDIVPMSEELLKDINQTVNNLLN
jgi:hypothetical protein